MGMTLEETNCFKMLDEYARTRHRCFLAEMDLKPEKANYALCFRPTGGGSDSPNRYACRYLYIGAEEVGIIGQTLPASIIEMLDRELPALPQPQLTKTALAPTTAQPAEVFNDFYPDLSPTTSRNRAG